MAMQGAEIEDKEEGVPQKKEYEHHSLQASEYSIWRRHAAQPGNMLKI
jgi:hypothetical protein